MRNLTSMPATNSLAQAPTQRLLSLDVLRGATIALMILVNTPGSWSHVYAPFLHAKWHGLTLTDLVFPSFVFIVGVSLYFSLGRYGWAGASISEGAPRPLARAFVKVARRTGLIFLVGLLLNAFPFYDVVLGELRIYGVLQRIALSYGLAATLCLLIPPRRWLLTAGGVAVLYWAVLALGGGAAPYALETNVVRHFDLATLGADHLYGGFGVPFDPEGFLGLLGTAINMLLGAYAGYLIKRNPDVLSADSGTTALERSVKPLLLFGLVLVVIGLALGEVLPVNKPLWTSSYALLTSGITACALGVCIEWVDVRGHRRGLSPFVHFGANPLVIYALSSVLAKAAYAVFTWTGPDDQPVSLYNWLYSDVFARLIPVPKLASLAFALLVVALCWSVAYWMYRRRIYVKL